MVLEKRNKEMHFKESVAGDGMVWIPKHFTLVSKRNQRVATALHTYTPFYQIEKGLFWVTSLTVH